MIVDTNVYGALQRAEPELLQLVAKNDEIFVPLPVLAELKAGFLKGSLTERNMLILDEFLAASKVVVLGPSDDTADTYAQLQALCWRQGRALSNNDVWIAALSRERDDTLVTYDKGFAVFQELFGEKLVILSRA